MKAGIVSETLDNIEVCRILCNKILSKIGKRIRVASYNQYSNKTQVLPKDFSQIDKFFRERETKSPKLIVLVTDRDGNKRHKTSFLENQDKVSLPLVIGMPEEKIEDWLISDMSAINRVFGTRLTLTTRNKNFDSKEWIKELRTKYLPQKNYREVCIAIAQNIKVDMIKRGFPQFTSDLLKCMENLTRPKGKRSFRKLSRKEKEVQRKLSRNRRPLPKQIRENR